MEFQKTQQNQIAEKLPKIVAVAGGKGGIGKTVLSIAVALELIKSDFNITLIDADLGGANLAPIFGISDSRKTIRDFLIGNVSELEELVQPSDIAGLRLITGSLGDYGLANIEYNIKQKFLRKLKLIQSDWIILDLGAGTFFDILDFFNAAEIGIVVTTPDPMAVQDCFNFIKLSLFRKIYTTFHKVKELQNTVKQFLYSHRDEELEVFDQIKKHIFDKNEQYIDDWNYIISSFKPVLVLNRIMDEDDHKEGMALQIALRELFGISIQSFATVHYDEAVQQITRNNDTNQFLNQHSVVGNDVHRLVQQFLLKKENIPEKTAAENNFDKKMSIVEKDQLVCSVNCELWENCSMQMGGYPCRIPALGYINQKK